MSSTQLLLQSLLRRQEQEEQFNRQLMGNSMLTALNSFLTLMEQAQTSADVKSAYSALNRQWKVMTKDMDGAPEFLVSPMDIENAVKTVESREGAAAFLASSAAAITADMLEGRLGLSDAVNRFNKDITDAGKKFGAGVATALSAPHIENITKRWVNKQTLSMQAKMQMLPMIRDALSSGVNMDDFQKHLFNNESVAMARVASNWGVNPDLPGATLDAAKLRRAAVYLKLDYGKIRDWSPEEQVEAARVGNRMFDSAVGEVAQAQLDTLMEMAGVVAGVHAREGAVFLTALGELFPEVWGDDGTLTQMGQDLLSGGAWPQASAKLDSADGEATPPLSGDFVRVRRMVHGLARSGVFDGLMEGIPFSELSEAEIGELMNDGTLEPVLDKVRGRAVNENGKPIDISLNDLLFDDSGGLRSTAVWFIGSRDPDLIRGGDPETWNAMYWSRDSLPFDDYQSPSGKGYVEALVATATDKDGDTSEFVDAAVGQISSTKNRLWGGFKLLAHDITKQVTGKSLLSESGMETALLQSTGQGTGELGFSEKELAEIAPILDDGIERGIIPPPTVLPPDHPMVRAGDFETYFNTTIIEKATQFLRFAPPEERARLMGTEAGRRIYERTRVAEIAPEEVSKGPLKLSLQDIQKFKEDTGAKIKSTAEGLLEDTGEAKGKIRELLSARSSTRLPFPFAEPPPPSRSVQLPYPLAAGTGVGQQSLIQPPPIGLVPGTPSPIARPLVNPGGGVPIEPVSVPRVRSGIKPPGG